MFLSQRILFAVLKSACIAILFIRLPLDFNTTSLTGRQEALNQVHKHMRLCINVHEGFDACDTVQPAEPLLALAAAQIARSTKLNYAVALDENLQGPSLDKGDRGELVAMLILLLARDAAVKRDPERPEQHHVKLVDMMEKLLGQRWHENVLKALPSRLRTNDDKKSFEDAFEESIVYFTQFIKVHNSDVINRELLWFAIARGAAIMCKDCQKGVDLIIPFVVGNQNVGPKTISAIFIQVKNDASFGPSPDDLLFPKMNPHRIGFLDRGAEPEHPIIRMVFALGAKTSNVEVTPLPQTRPPSKRRKTSASDSTKKTKKIPPGVTSYDIWCARASGETFSVIEDDSLYQRLLKVDKAFPSAYETPIPTEQIMRKQMHPMAFHERPHWVAANPEIKLTGFVYDEDPSYNEVVCPPDEEET